MCMDSLHCNSQGILFANLNHSMLGNSSRYERVRASWSLALGNGDEVAPFAHRCGGTRISKKEISKSQNGAIFLYGIFFLTQ